MEQREGIKRIYRKSWPIDNLFGSSRFDFTAATRGIWNDFLDMAKISRVRPGVIAPAEDKAYPHIWLAEFLNVSLEELEAAIKIFVSTGRISENHNGIEVINWKRYQPEYDRQKPYREQKRRPTFSATTAEDVQMQKKYRNKVISHQEFRDYISRREEEETENKGKGE